MTEKRFYKVLTDCVVQDTLNNELIRGSRIANVMNALYEENKELKEENKELHRLNHEEVENWSDEKKQMIAEFSNLMFGDKINDKKQKNNWKNKH